MENIGDLVATATLDISPFEKNSKNLKTYVKGLDSSLKAMENSFKGQSRSFSNYSNRLNSLKGVYSQTGQSLKAYQSLLTKQSDHYNNLKSEIGDINNATEAQKGALLGARNAMTETAAKVATLQNSYSSLGKEIAIQSSSWTRIGTVMQSAGARMQTIGQSISGVGSAFTRGVTTPIVAGAGIAIKKATEFENQMMTTRALLADTVPANKLNSVINQLSDSSKKWAVQYGVSTASVNDGMNEMVKKGYNAKQVMGAMPSVLQASRASGEDFNTVMNASTSILEQFGLKSNTTAGMVKNTARVTDSLTFVANKTAAGFKDMGEAMEYVGPVAKSVGMSVEDTSAAIGLLSNNGIEGQKAGTALRGALTRLLKPSKQNAAAMKELGFSADEFKKGQIGLPDIIDRIKKSTEGMTEAEKASLIAKAFGTESQTAMNALVNQGGDALRKLTGETKNATGYTKQLSDAMGQSAQAKFAQAKEKIEVLAITMGQKLLPMVVPIVEDIGKMVDAFSKLDPAIQTNILKWGLLAAGIGPVLSIFGKATSGFGTLVSGIGKVSGAIGKLRGLSTAAEGVAEVGTAATGAETATAGFSGALGLLTNPIGLTIAAAGALTVGLIALNHAKDKAREKAEEWGTTLNSKTRGELTAFKSKVDETSNAMVQFDAKGSSALNNVKNSFSTLMSEIQNSKSKADARLDELGKKLGLSDEQIAKGKERNAQIVANAQTMTDQIKAIYEKHNGNTSRLTAEEKSIVENNQRQLINAKLSLMNLSNAQEKAVRQAFNQDVTKLNETQLKSTMASLEKAMQSEKKAYATEKADLKEALESGMISRKDYNSKKEQLETQHQAVMNGLGEKYVQASQRRDQLLKARLRDFTSNNEQNTAKAKAVLKELGVSYDDLANKVNSASKKGTQGTELLAQSTAKMTEKTKNANALWNTMVFDEKTGKVKTNAKEEIAKAISSKEGWDSMQFMLKNANIKSNARLEVASALVENGKWNSMTLEQKKLVVDGKAGLLAIANSKQNLNTWNSMPTTVKNLLANNSDFVNKSSSAKHAMDTWNALSPKTQELLAKDMASPNKAIAQAAINSLTGKTVDIGAFNATSPGVTAANIELGNVKDKHANISSTNSTSSGVISAIDTMGAVPNVTRNINANNNTAGPSSSASALINAVHQNSPVGINATNRAGGPASSAQSSVNSVHGKNVNITASDHASGVISGIAGWLGSLHDKVINVITHHSEHARGTAYHQGGLALVNDQKGPNYREMVTLPGGTSFIPEGRNVMLPLPRGSRVLKASKTKQLFPQYADGIGFENTNISSIAKRIGNVNNANNQTVNVSSDNRDMVNILSQILSALTNTNNNIVQGNYTLNVNQTGGISDNRDTIQKLFKEFQWYIQQQKGRLSES